MLFYTHRILMEILNEIFASLTMKSKQVWIQVYCCYSNLLDSSITTVTMIWKYLGEIIFNMLVLVGLIKGSDRIIKEMLVTILYRNENEPNVKKPILFTDVDANSYYTNAVNWAQANEAMQYAVGNGIITGKSSATLNPLDNASRGEAATILMRFLETNK